jgi:hypothetical protein
MRNGYASISRWEVAAVVHLAVIKKLLAVAHVVNNAVI